MSSAHKSADKPKFVEFLDEVLPVIDQTIRDGMPTPLETSQEEDLERYAYEPLRRLVFAGGKRVRPALCLLGAKAVGSAVEVALSVARAVELFQAAALIHDDIADQSEMRRGMTCLHLSDGLGVAINVGDVGVVDVAAQVLHDTSLSPSTRLAVFDELYAMERYTLEGQALDLGWVHDNRWDLTEQDYLAMARLKTAHYSAASPLVLGALCAEGSSAQVDALRDFGLATGLAFQIKDDLLNLVGDAQAQGKDFRSDITEGKRTLVMVHALAHLDSRESLELQTILSEQTSDAGRLERAVELAAQAGSLDYARAFANQLVDKAKTRLANEPVVESAKDTLFSMADFFVNRDS